MLSHKNIYVINMLLIKYPSIHIFYARMKSFNMEFRLSPAYGWSWWRWWWWWKNILNVKSWADRRRERGIGSQQLSVFLFYGQVMGETLIPFREASSSIRGNSTFPNRRADQTHLSTEDVDEDKDLHTDTHCHVFAGDDMRKCQSCFKSITRLILLWHWHMTNCMNQTYETNKAVRPRMHCVFYYIVSLIYK